MDCLVEGIVGEKKTWLLPYKDSTVYPTKSKKYTIKYYIKSKVNSFISFIL